MAPASAAEVQVRRLCAQGAFVPATTAAIRAYGPEILGLLIALHRSDQDADEVFSLWSERVFRGLPGFAWACSLRTWAYTLAHNASANFSRARRARARREQAADSAEILAVEQQVRTETRPYLRTEVKDKLAALRQALPREDLILLVLRVDKRLEWKDLARVMLGEDAAVADDTLARESQRLRKRFQLLKGKLVDAARREGILGEDRQA